ncbi:MAG: hypothetical protein M2R46_04902 [Verrucomicrobia subdivision 3 bacterium]|nr:hypothetical protein [Limisphaerales bacterium]
MTITLLNSPAYELGDTVSGTIEIIDNDVSTEPAFNSIDHEQISIYLPSEITFHLQRSTDLIEWKLVNEIVGRGETVTINLDEFDANILFIRVIAKSLDVQ